jgi:hypothetical protein
LLVPTSLSVKTASRLQNLTLCNFLSSSVISCLTLESHTRHVLWNVGSLLKCFSFCSSRLIFVVFIHHYHLSLEKASCDVTHFNFSQRNGVTGPSQMVRPLRYGTAPSQMVRPLRYGTAPPQMVRPIRYGTAPPQMVRPLRYRTAPSQMVRPLRYGTAPSQMVRPLRYGTAPSQSLR